MKKTMVFLIFHISVAAGLKSGQFNQGKETLIKFHTRCQQTPKPKTPAQTHVVDLAGELTGFLNHRDVHTFDRLIRVNSARAG